MPRSNRNVDEAKLERYLELIGKETFVRFFEQLSDFSLSKQDVAQHIANELGCTYSAALTWRVSPARTIIRAGNSKAALLRISQSARLPDYVTKAAAALAMQQGRQE